MPKLHEVVAGTVSGVGGTLYGRLKIQKILYLLDQIGLGSGASYFYHHYGPYSEDISSAIMDAQFFGLLSEETGHRKSDGVAYNYFKSSNDANSDDLGSADFIKKAILLNAENPTDLEIAATIHWLTNFEKNADWKKEIKTRKKSKASDERIQSGLSILEKLGINP